MSLAYLSGGAAGVEYNEKLSAFSLSLGACECWLDSGSAVDGMSAWA